MKSWVKKGSRPDEYEIGIDDRITYTNKRSALLKSVVDQAGGFGTLMQSFKADAYRDKRVRFSAAVKTTDVTGWAGLWMRVDGPRHDKSLAFDNMEKRPITGTTDWQTYEVVLDVPAEATLISFGILVHGTGQAWISDVCFEVVNETVLVTAIRSVKQYEDKPGNLDFSE